MLESLESCSLCPRNCRADRLAGQVGFCKAGKDVRLARVSLHHWEEPCISGSRGSGTVFFSNCNLRCVFCQNHKISQESYGKDVSIERLAEIFMGQQNKGAHNINLVTPTHYVPQIIEAVKLAKKSGLAIPILYNTNSYENVETIKSLEGIVDVYLADLKYFNNSFAKKYSCAENYFLHASKAIGEMFRQTGPAILNREKLVTKGVIVRHLMLPGLLFDTKKLIDYLFEEYGDSIFISLMNQYTPIHNAAMYPEINRGLNPRHYDSIIDYCIDKGIHNAFIQDQGTASEDYVPDFDLDGV
ncbi:MAG: radical SAM protein [Clostridiaceae bacterium]